MYLFFDKILDSDIIKTIGGKVMKIKNYKISDISIPLTSYNFFNNTVSILDKYYAQLNKSIPLEKSDIQGLHKLIEEIDKKNNLSLRERRQLFIKLDKIFQLNLFLMETRKDTEDLLINRNYYDKYNYLVNALNEFYQYKQESLLMDYNNDKIDEIFNLYQKIVKSDYLSSNERKLLISKLDSIFINLIDIKDIFSYMKKRNYIEDDLIKKIILIKASEEKNFSLILHFLTDNYQKLSVNFCNSIIDKLNLSQRIKYVNDIMLDGLNYDISLFQLKVLYLILFYQQNMKMVNINNIELIKKFINMLTNNFFINDNNFNSMDYNILIKRIQEVLPSFLKKLNENTIISDIATGKINLNRDWSKISSNLNLKFTRLPHIRGRNIITIDDSIDAKDMDTAFSIKKVKDYYLLDIYVSNVPYFLVKNKDLAKEAYFNGKTYYIRNVKNGRSYSIDMLPTFLSHDLLSLNKNGLKNVVDFHFVISLDGKILKCHVSNNQIYVNHSLTRDTAKKILKNGNNFLIRNDLLCLQQLSNILTNNSEISYKHLINNNDLVAITSILVNYYVGNNASLAIYRDNGKYTKKNSGYTHSVTPIRCFAADINLGLFLNQLGLLPIDDKDIYLIEDNIDEIIDHLNEIDRVSQYVGSHSYQIKKHLNLK